MNLILTVKTTEQNSSHTSEVEFRACRSGDIELFTINRRGAGAVEEKIRTIRAEEIPNMIDYLSQFAEKFAHEN